MRPLLTIPAVLALCTLARAQIESGLYTSNDGYTANIEVTDTNGSGTPGVDVTVTDAGGSAVANGVAASGSTDQKPKASSFPTTTTPRGSREVRGANGKVQVKKNGKWTNMTKTKKKQGGKRSPNRSLVPPSSPPVRSAPHARSPISPGRALDQASDVASGEEGSSLPGPGAHGPPTL